jgi:phosphate transport system substrate-binding protein
MFKPLNPLRSPKLLNFQGMPRSQKAAPLRSAMTYGRPLAIAFTYLSLYACGPQVGAGGGDTPQTLTLTGSSTVAPLASEIGKRYEQQHPDTRIDVQSGGSSRGIADARSGVSDFGLVSRALKPEESDLTAYPIAYDGISIILHRNNSVKTLSDAQIQGIYTKQIRNWKEVGGQDAPITVVSKAEGRSTLELFSSYFKIPTEKIQADVIIGDNPQGVKTVIGNPNAIGYVSIGAAEVEIQQGAPLKLLPINGIPATLKTVQDQSFPITRPLNLVIKNVPESDLAKDFLQFSQSPEVQDLVKSQYFVPIPR